MSLREILKRADWRVRTSQQCVTDLDETVDLPPNHERWTSAGLAKLFGRKVAGTIDETFKAIPGMDWIRLLLAGGGIDFSDDETRAGLIDMRDAGLLTPEIVNTLLEIGRPTAKLFAVEGLASLPTVEEIDAERATIATEEVRQKLADRYNATVEAMEAGQAVTWDQVRTLLGAE